MADLKNNKNAKLQNNIHNNTRNSSGSAIATKRPIRGFNKVNHGGNIQETSNHINKVGETSEIESTKNHIIGRKNGLLSSVTEGIFNSNGNFSASSVGDTQSETFESSDVDNFENVGIKKVLKSALMVALVFVAFLGFLLIFLLLLITPLIVLGIIDLGDLTNSFSLSSGYSSGTAYTNFVSTTSSDYYFPIGSSDTVNVDGVDYAIGTPSSTTITATFAGNDAVHKGSHGAVDISAVVNGENVIAVNDGTVIYPTVNDRIDYPNGYYCSRDGQGYGNFVIIDHGDKIISLYGHMYQNSITVRAGDVVKKGQVIGRTGTSGCSTGGHLHFEMRYNGNKIDPFEFVSITNPRGKNDVSEMVE